MEQKKVAASYQYLLSAWDGPYGGVPPWDKLDNIEHFEPAMREAGRLMHEEINKIADQTAAATFDNTLLPLEKSGEELDRVATLFFTLSSSRNTPEVQKASAILSPLLSKFYDEVYFNEKLFERIKTIYADKEKLSPDQQRLTEKMYERFERNGANLDAESKSKLGKINETLAKLFEDFGNRVLADENTWIELQHDDLDGLPSSLVSAYAQAAKDQNLKGHIVMNTRSAVDPFLAFSSRRDLREKVWRAFVSRGDNKNEHNTNAQIQDIVKLRAQRAKLLGYPSHAHWRMSNTMAKTPQRAMELMMAVWPAALKKVEVEVGAMQKIALEQGQKEPIAPWDYHFYMEKYRAANFDLDQNEFKNYFELDNIIKASYYMAEKLYGLTFKEITGTVPTFHEDVRVYEVHKKPANTYVGLLYRDDFARTYKRSGAWMSSYRIAKKLDKIETPIVSNNNNFTKVGEGEPILISIDDATTLFHEFGHAIHGLLTDVAYPSLGRTPRDFVEFPSQVHENWLLTRDILDTYARHYKTDKPMPDSLITKMRAAASYNQGFATVEYLSAAILDMKLHMDPTGEVDPKKFEEEELKAINMPEQIVLRHRLPHFLHLFASDSYSAGYYSYLWSDVMATDTWQAFEDSPWNAELADKFAKFILSTGDATDRAEAYRLFIGRDPKVEALLKNRGL